MRSRLGAGQGFASYFVPGSFPDHWVVESGTGGAGDAGSDRRLPGVDPLTQPTARGVNAATADGRLPNQPYDADVPDQKPPRLAGGERETLLALLQYHRDSLVRKVTGIDDESARRRFVGSDTTLLWLVRHAAGAEARWVLWSFAGELDGVRDDAAGPDDTLAEAVNDYRATWAEVDSVVSAASLDDRCRAVSGDDVVNLRWIMTHLLEETARHAGHADILRELIDGQVGR